MNHQPSRRTLVKGAVWSLPVVAMAQPALAQDVVCSPGSCPPPPTFDFGNAYKNPGNSCTTRCVPRQSYGVPVTISNPSSQDFILHFTSYTIGTLEVGVHSVVLDTTECDPPATGCSTGTCGRATARNSVCVPPGGSLTVYVTSGSYGSSPNEGQAIGWQWIRKSDCTVVTSGTATSPVSPPGCDEGTAEVEATEETPTDETTVDETTADETAVEEAVLETPGTTDEASSTSAP